MLGGLLGGLAGKLISRGARSLTKRITGGGGGSKLPKLAAGGAAAAALPALPGAGRAVAGAAGRVLRNPAVQGAAGAVAAGQLFDANGNPVKKRRRGRGFSARDIRQTRRVLKMLKEMQSAVPRRRCA